MRVFVTGANGQLGGEVMEELMRRGLDCVGSGRSARPRDGRAPYLPVDITDEGAVSRALDVLRPDAVIHCAAWTAVDAAEDPENAAEVRAVNADGSAHIARACRRLDCKLLYLSTDYVFDGAGDAPYKPDGGRFGPLNFYGLTKREGEIVVQGLLRKFFLVRTGWVFGEKGDNFVKTMLKLGRERTQLRVVSDQMGTPCYARDLSRLLVDMAQTELYGSYHATNEGGYISRCAFARAILRRGGCSAELVPVTSAEYGAAGAVRPLNGRLDTTKLREAGFAPLPPWEDALDRYFAEVSPL